MRVRSKFLAWCYAGAALAQSPVLDHFETKIRPVLVARCYGCHSAGAAAIQGGLRLDSAAAMQRGGNSGPVLVAGRCGRQRADPVDSADGQEFADATGTGVEQRCGGGF